MKKFFASFISVILICFIFTSFSPSLDGRAVVAESGVMPQGVFAKTVGYLPGDSISVTNLAENATVDILVIGSLDASEGVAIMLSPEAAELLGIKKDSNNVVKITKRTGQLDEAVGGTAVISKSADNGIDYVENATTEEPPKEELPEQKVEEVAKTAEPEATVEIADTAETVVEEPVQTEIPEPVVEPEPIEVANVGEIVPEKIEPDILDDKNKVVVENEKIEENEPAEKVVEVIEEVVATENIEMPCEENICEKVGAETFDNYDVKEEKIIADDLSPCSDKCFYEKIPDEPLDEFVEANEEHVDADKIVIIDESKKDMELVAQDGMTDSSDVLSEKYDDVLKSDNENIVDAKKVDVDEFADLEDENAETDYYESIILSPSALNPPATEQQNENVASQNLSEMARQPEVLEPLKPNENVIAMRNDNVILKDDYNFSGNTVSSLHDLESGKYYVQIAVYNEPSNIKTIFDKYQEMYPITLVPLVSKKATQVLIGPLSVDEYGTVLNRFKAYGYKDAFLRKIR